jgi:hypothetical protein
MHMAVDEPRQHELAAQVHDARARRGDVAGDDLRHPAVADDDRPLAFDPPGGGISQQPAGLDIGCGRLLGGRAGRGEHQRTGRHGGFQHGHVNKFPHAGCNIKPHPSHAVDG